LNLYRNALFLGSLLFLVLAPLTSSATTVRSLSTSDMVREAAICVRGKVLARTGTWSPDKSAIYTDTRIAIQSIIVGRTRNKALTVRQLGGVVGKVEMGVVGTAPMRVGEEVLLFLRTDGQFHYVVGMVQGKYSVIQRNGKTIVTRDLAGVHQIHRTQRVGIHRPLKNTRTTLRFDAFTRELRAIAKSMGK
jgi:hypothetical protein